MIPKINSQILTGNIFLISIMIIAAVLRFWHLGQNPPSLNWDEASNGYNAYSILKTGRDEYGNFLPLTFRAFGDYNPAMSVYTLVPSIAAFGLNEVAVRFPSALFGTLTVFLTYLLVLKLTKNKKIALISCLLLAISPWHLQFSRYDHEANFMVFFAILGLTIFVIKPKNYLFLLLSTFAFGLGLNSYHSAKVWMPLFLAGIIFWHLKEIAGHKSKLFLPVFLLILFTLPILMDINKSLIRANAVGIFNSKENPAKTFVSGYLSHFSPNFLFVSGDLNGRHSVSGMGELYVFELPLIVLGLFTLVREKSRASKFLLTWLLLAPIPAALAQPTPHALRSLTFMPLWSIIAAYGANATLKLKSQKRLRSIIIMFIVMLAVYNFTTYVHLYWKHYPKLNARDWQDGYKEMVNYVVKIKDNYDVVAISNYYGKPYIFVLLYSKFDPKFYQSQSQDKSKFDNYEFFGQSWEKKTTGRALLVRPEWQIPDPPPHYIKYIYDNSGQLTFRISEE